jgi:hypothetical protein
MELEDVTKSLFCFALICLYLRKCATKIPKSHVILLCMFLPSFVGLVLYFGP